MFEFVQILLVKWKLSRTAIVVSEIFFLFTEYRDWSRGNGENKNSKHTSLVSYLIKIQYETMTEIFIFLIKNRYFVVKRPSLLKHVPWEISYKKYNIEKTCCYYILNYGKSWLFFFMTKVIDNGEKIISHFIIEHSTKYSIVIMSKKLKAVSKSLK